MLVGQKPLAQGSSSECSQEHGECVTLRACLLLDARLLLLRGTTQLRYICVPVGTCTLPGSRRNAGKGQFVIVCGRDLWYSSCQHAGLLGSLVELAFWAHVSGFSPWCQCPHPRHLVGITVQQPPEPRAARTSPTSPQDGSYLRQDLV